MIRVAIAARSGTGRVPTANVDIAPTITRILGFNMPNAEGRVLEEALLNGPSLTQYTVRQKTYQSSRRTGLKMKLPTDVDGRAVDPTLTSYFVELRTKTLSRNGMSWSYFDEARVIRQ